MRIGIITGSGTYSLPGFEDTGAGSVDTPFGPARVTEGTFAGADVLHVARHGEGHAVLAVTVCGACDLDVELGSLIVFDDLHFLANRLPDGSICTLHTEPRAPGRGHWIFDRPFAPELRTALLAGAREAGVGVRDGGCYGHVDGPRFNTRTEIRMLANAGVTAVSQTAGPETVLSGEAKVPYALVGYATDYANGVPDEPTPVDELVGHIEASTETFAQTLTAAMPHILAADPQPVGTHFEWD